MFKKILIANRGAIACRIIRTCKQMGIATVAIYTKADNSSLHIDMADEAVCIGEARPAETYLDYQRIMDIAEAHNCEAIHPGYGFLSENTKFATACEQRGLQFIGPRPEQISAFGLKHTARELADKNGVLLLPGSGLLQDETDAAEQAARIGYPLMLKSTAGGGGIGMRLCLDETALRQNFTVVSNLGKNNFGDGGVFVEKYIRKARHIEVQIFGDGKGKVVVLGERDCSLQRRNQKVLEETPAPAISAMTRQDLFNAARKLGVAVNYRSAGTVEFLYDPASEQFYFLEVNTRLQVEHGVTEEVTGIDLVEWMIRLAAGETAFITAYIHQPSGHALQARLYAEDPGKNFQPSTGTITRFFVPDTVRCETWVTAGTKVSPWYDPMIAKIIVKDQDRVAAINKMAQALSNSHCDGLETNLDYLRQICNDDTFIAAGHSTDYLDSFTYSTHTFTVQEAGTQTTIQDYPGRLGYWDVGVPPSGPMDSLAFRLGNSLLGNDTRAAGLELVFTGPSLRFNTATRIVLTGANMKAELNGKPVPAWSVIGISRQDVLKLGAIEGAGTRSYLLIQGGIDVPDYLGSKSTFTLGRFGGINGEGLKPGDVVHIHARGTQTKLKAINRNLIPAYEHHCEVHVIYGPHGAPDFFTSKDIDTFFNTDWQVHFNSSRTGIRLIGPPPEWARKDGGEAGLHPSNIHDTAYAVGSIDFTGDMPVILGPDGPSLGGFVCPATIIKADLWKLGQFKAGDTIRFVPVSIDQAYQMEEAQNRMIESLQYSSVSVKKIRLPSSPIIHQLAAERDRPQITYRASGEDNLLIEYGPMELDINLRFRVHMLMQHINTHTLAGIIEVTPGIRSLQVHYDSLRLHQGQLIKYLLQTEDKLSPINQLEVPGRIVHLPLSWDDESTRLAIKKYTQSVRPDAPWCPSNIEFIRRINGLGSIDDVKNIVFNASYLVMGLGDVYLGAPVATPLDPRHRLVTTKYNPARTWTPENAVGIGGSYLCIYGMEGPGGYQFVGRTLQMWNRYKQTDTFQGNQRWLLRFFDQIRFFPVSEQELLTIREEFPLGRYRIRTEDQPFRLADYNAFLQQNAESIHKFKSAQQKAFDTERRRWEEQGLAIFSSGSELAKSESETITIGETEKAAIAQMPGSVWKIAVLPGEHITQDQTVLILESMKMEFHVPSPCTGTVSRILCREGEQIRQGQQLILIETAN